MSDIVEYLKNQATIALKNGNKLSCAALTLASQLVSATQENESLRQQLADTQRKLEAAQSRHAAEREALVAAIKELEYAPGIYGKHDMIKAILALLSDSGSQG